MITPVSWNNGYDGASISGNLILPISSSAGGGAGVYDYFVRDYQENVRMILTEEVQTSVNLCTMETARASNETPYFGQLGANNEVTTTRLTTKPAGWASNTSSAVAKLSKLSGHTIGPNSLLKVMAGDVLNASADYYYPAAVTNNTNSLVGDIVSTLVQAISGSATTTQAVKNGTAEISGNLTPSFSFESVADPNRASPGTTPRAYLSILFFDERFNFVSESSKAVRVSQPGSGAPQLVLPMNTKAPKNGYAYIYLSNESDDAVYFDNLQVSDTRGRIIEEDHYYAFGLKIAGISSTKLGDANEGNINNKNLYNDKELIDEADLNWYDYGFRNYDPQIGRFPQLDPLTDDYPHYTPYQYAGNEPIANVDLDGLEELNVLGEAFKGAQNAVQQTVIVTAHVIKQGSNVLQQGLKLAGSFTLGVANAWASNQVLGAGRTDAVKNGLTDANGVAFQIGQGVGAFGSMVSGSGEVTGGAAGEIASFGGAIVAAVPLIAHCATAFWNGLYHLVNGRIVYYKGSYNENHSDPKWAGGDPNQPTVTMKKSDHVDFHNEMNNFLRSINKKLAPSRGNSGKDIFSRFGRNIILDAVAKFYKSPIAQQKFKAVADQFFKLHPNLK